MLFLVCSETVRIPCPGSAQPSLLSGGFPGTDKVLPPAIEGFGTFCLGGPLSAEAAALKVLVSGNVELSYIFAHIGDA